MVPTTSQNARPYRRQVTDELGRVQTLDSTPHSFDVWGHGPQLVVLGVGPDPAALARHIAGQPWGAAAGQTAVAYVECPAFVNQMEDATLAGTPWRQQIPSHWRAVEPTALTAELLCRARIVHYRPAARFFSRFWGPVIAAARLAAVFPPPVQAEAWLPCRKHGLLSTELTDALKQCGLPVRVLDADTSHQQQLQTLLELLRHGRPSHYISVNFAGLDGHGEIFELLRAAGTSVAVWCVDNPFHLLTGIKGPWWRQAQLCVTDDSFIPLLRQHGAQRVQHLPLAAWSGFGTNATASTEAAEKLVFVGRSSFPGKDRFFAGIRLTPQHMALAQAMLADGQRPDFLWWVKQLGVQQLWPGNAVRQAGLGAEECGAHWRALCLNTAAQSGVPLLVYGDAAWLSLAPALSPGGLKPAVDYYGPLAGIYGSATAVLNCTSPLLPHGLTQRHFDVWAAGGLLLTDATPGLNIFPDELTELVRFTKPAELAALYQRYIRDSALRDDVVDAWRQHIGQKHMYKHRMTALLGAGG